MRHLNFSRLVDRQSTPSRLLVMAVFLSAAVGCGTAETTPAPATSDATSSDLTIADGSAVGEDGAATEPDAGTPDAGTPDAGTPDAGTPDAGTTDAGPTDAGTRDAGTPDAGTPDAGTPDAGTAAPYTCRGTPACLVFAKVQSKCISDPGCTPSGFSCAPKNSGGNTYCPKLKSQSKCQEGGGVGCK